MKTNQLLRISALSILFTLTFILCGCPYSSVYKLDGEPAVPIDETLIGKWATMVTTGSGDEQPLKMIVAKRSDFEYDMSFIGQINDLRYFNVLTGDTLKATAFLSEAASRRFLNVQVKGETFIAEMVQKDGKLNLLPLCEHFTVKMIRNNEELRTALEWHFKTRLYPLYDPEFCLKQMSRVN